MLVLQENSEYRYEFERIQNKWWHTLVHKPTGMAQTLIDSNKKKESLNLFGDLDILGIKDAMDRWGVTGRKAYKIIEGV